MNFLTELQQDVLIKICNILLHVSNSYSDIIFVRSIINSGAFYPAQISSFVLNSNLYSIEQRIIIMKSIYHLSDKIKNKEKILYSLFSLELFFQIIKIDKKFAIEIIENMPIRSLCRETSSLNWSYKKIERSMYCKDVLLFLLEHGMKRLIKGCSGSKLSSMIQMSCFPEYFTPSAYKKIPPSQWSHIITHDYKKWKHCSNITKIPGSSAMSLIKKDPSIMILYPEMKDWRLSGKQWKQLINNPNVVKYLPKDHEIYISFLLLKGK